MADYTALTVVKNLPKGIHSGNRYIKTYPGHAGECRLGRRLQGEIQRISDQLVVGERDRDACSSPRPSKKANSADGKKIAEAMRGPDDQVAVRRRRHRDDARRGPHPGRLCDRLGHHDPAGALCAGGQGRRLEDRSSSSKPSGRRARATPDRSATRRRREPPPLLAECLSRADRSGAPLTDVSLGSRRAHRLPRQSPPAW